MHVVGHEHPCPNAHLGLRAMFAQQIKIKLIVVVTEKGLRPTIATLCDVVGQVRDHDARQTSHRGRIGSKPRIVNLMHCHRNSGLKELHFVAFDINTVTPMHDSSGVTASLAASVAAEMLTLL